jgi:DNA replication protein
LSTGSFGGFSGGSRATAVPNVFFTTLLPQIAEPSELIVSVYLFFFFGRRRDTSLATTLRDLMAELPLVQALQKLPGDPRASLRDGLRRAVERGTLLKLANTDGGEDSYVINTQAARRSFERRAPAARNDADFDDPVSSAVRPNIYALYEDNIGPLSPLIIDDLGEAEQAFPPAWIEAAFREAVENNHRSWRYISRILQRWSIEGPDYEATGRRPARDTGSRRRTIGGPYRRVVEGRD